MLFYHPDLTGKLSTLSSEESAHIIRVLRCKNGDNINITDGKGNLASAAIREANPRRCLIEILSVDRFEPDPYYIHIAISPTKNIDRLNWFVEKAVEIGIHEISFPKCKNNVRLVLNTEKLKTKAISALKQSMRCYLPVINELNDFRNIIEAANKSNENLICHLENKETPELVSAVRKGNHYFALIGPEGDFTQEEVEMALSKGFRMVKLGNQRLRTETAALHACSILNAINY